MLKQLDGHLIGLMPDRQDDKAEMNEAPVAGTTEASKKFLNSLIQGKLDMNATSSTVQSQFVNVQNALDVAVCAMEQVEALRSILSLIAKATTDEDIRTVAIHGKTVAFSLHNDLDVFREDVESGELA